MKKLLVVFMLCVTIWVLGGQNYKGEAYRIEKDRQWKPISVTIWITPTYKVTIPWENVTRIYEEGKESHEIK